MGGRCGIFLDRQGKTKSWAIRFAPFTTIFVIAKSLHLHLRDGVGRHVNNTLFTCLFARICFGILEVFVCSFMHSLHVNLCNAYAHLGSARLHECQ